MPVILQVIIGGALGALSRYGVSQILPASNGMRFPWNTFTANLVGCLVIGVVMGFVLNNSMGKQYLPLIIIGFLGGFTTFSSFGWETIQLFQNKHTMLAVYYVLGTNIAGLLLVFVGYKLSQL